MSDKKITIKEFKMWLEGVEEMQDDDWVPSPIQWKRIRTKIDNIDDGVGTQTKPETFFNIPQSGLQSSAVREGVETPRTTFVQPPPSLPTTIPPSPASSFENGTLKPQPTAPDGTYKSSFV